MIASLRSVRFTFSAAADKTDVDIKNPRNCDEIRRSPRRLQIRIRGDGLDAR